MGKFVETQNLAFFVDDHDKAHKILCAYGVDLPERLYGKARKILRAYKQNYDLIISSLNLLVFSSLLLDHPMGFFYHSLRTLPAPSLCPLS